jgi:hypothetical protein
MAGERSRSSAKIAKKAATKRATVKPILLAGGNPQIAKGDGDAPSRLHRRDAELETRHRAQPRRPHRAQRPRRAKGREVELAFLRARTRAGSIREDDFAEAQMAAWVKQAAAMPGWSGAAR